jgi:hypothetical protein
MMASGLLAGCVITGVALAAAPLPAGASCQTIVTAQTTGSAASCPGALTLAVLRPGPITWCYQVRNTGDTLLSGISVVDSVFGVLAGNLGDLAPGDVSVPLAISGEPVLGTHAAQAAGSIDSVTIQCAQGDVTVVQAAPGIDLQLTAAVDGRCPGHSDSVATRGTDITYCYAVRNTDDVTTLTNIEVTHDLFGPEPVGSIDTLAPGATQILSATKPMLMHQQTSFATASGAPVFGQQTFPPVAAQNSTVIDVR